MKLVHLITVENRPIYVNPDKIVAVTQGEFPGQTVILNNGGKIAVKGSVFNISTLLAEGNIVD